MRPSNTFLLYLAGNLLMLCFLAAHAFFHAAHAEPLLRRSAELVRTYELSDLCLFTEASYTRHLTQADRHTAFQDHPVCLEHFPSGALHMPPDILRRSHARLD